MGKNRLNIFKMEYFHRILESYYAMMFTYIPQQIRLLNPWSQQFE
uniref:Uncharacterized protein n=1 Tax=Rhizophora mucronata TaxID=61149 RepID=A0A2P2NZT8_RHIMU